MNKHLIFEYKTLILNNNAIALFSYLVLLLLSFCCIPIASALIWMGMLRVVSFLWIILCLIVLGFMGMKVVEPAGQAAIQFISLLSPTLLTFFIHLFVQTNGGFGVNYLADIYFTPLTAMSLHTDHPNYLLLMPIPTLFLWLGSQLGQYLKITK